MLASQHATPLIWTRRDGYRLAPELADVIGYERAQFRMEFTRITRLITATIDPHHARWSDDDWIRLVRAQLGGVQAAMEMLATLDNGGGPQARAGHR